MTETRNADEAKAAAIVWLQNNVAYGLDRRRKAIGAECPTLAIIAAFLLISSYWSVDLRGPQIALAMLFGGIAGGMRYAMGKIDSAQDELLQRSQSLISGLRLSADFVATHKFESYR